MDSPVAGAGAWAGAGLVCPTYACQWLGGQAARLVTCLSSHHSTLPAITVLASFSVWLYDILTDAAIIQKLWGFNLNEVRTKSTSSLHCNVAKHFRLSPL